jgi:3-hydroxyacyl-CoA dehydrogenase
MNHIATLTITDGIATILIDYPPVNALAAPVRGALLTALDRAATDPEVVAVVLACAGRTFVAGADIGEFGRPPQPPSFEQLFDAIENAPKPIIAAIHGTALGGGFELTLVCHYRLAAADARVGLPEVNLGLLPGAGGTQRLPRLVGVKAALEIMTSGRMVKAKEALELGLVDALASPEDLLDQASAFARRIVVESGLKPRIRDRAAPAFEADVFAEFRASQARRFRGFRAPEAIVQCVEAAATLPFDEGIAREQALFRQLENSTESAAQRHYFFAERETTRVPDIDRGTPVLDVRTVGVIGAGTMGGGITMNFLHAGLPVTLVETSQEALDRGVGVIRRNYEASARKGHMTSEEVERRMALIRPSLDMTDLDAADLVIEAVYEDLDVKKAIFTQLDGIARPGAILASNTSFLDLDQIAGVTSRPEWVVGLHFFSPAHVMRLLEIVRGARTSPEVVATAMKLAKTIGKTPVLSRVCDGFIANRLMAPRGAQADALILEGASVSQVDRVLCDYGFAMGHFQMMDLVGLDVVGRSISERTVMGDLVAADRLGQKQNGGYYDYGDARQSTPSPVAERIIAEVARAKGVAPSSTKLDDQELLGRLLYPVVNEGARILEEGIALRSSDIDVAAILGYNWPLFTGGPMFWANTIGLDAVVAGLREMEIARGKGFTPSPLLLRLAEERKYF